MILIIYGVLGRYIQLRGTTILSNFKQVTKKASSNNYLSQWGEDTLLIYSPTSLSHINITNTKMHLMNYRVFKNDKSRIDEVYKNSQKYKNVISIGGGAATDIAKYIATIMNATFICIPAMLSTNAYSTNKAALLSGKGKLTHAAKLADQIIFDRSLLLKAREQNLYGLSDVLSIHTALFDWKLSNRKSDEALDSNIYKLANSLLFEVVDYILNNNVQTLSNNIEELYEYIGISGDITNIYGSGRPESGSEHIFAKSLESRTIIPHGISVALGIILVSIMQGSYSEDIERCIEKLGSLKYLDQYNVTRETLKSVLLALKPRQDRYSIIDE